MICTPTFIKDLYVIKPVVFEDQRGFFYESYNEEKFTVNGLQYRFVQDNHSKSTYGVIRGLHYQMPPHAQTKLVRAIQGAMLDVAVDVRQGSPTYGKHFSIMLSAENKQQLLIPVGFAHGFSVLTETAEVAYKCTDVYHPECDAGIIYNDPFLNIDWQIPFGLEIISNKDLANPLFENSQNEFVYE